jgi:basic membrane protein A
LDLIISGTWSVKELAQNIAVQFPKNIISLTVMSIERRHDGNMMKSYLDMKDLSCRCTGTLILIQSEKIDPINEYSFVGSMTLQILITSVGYIEGIKYIDPALNAYSYVGSFEMSQKLSK